MCSPLLYITPSSTPSALSMGSAPGRVSREPAHNGGAPRYFHDLDRPAQNMGTGDDALDYDDEGITISFQSWGQNDINAAAAFDFNSVQPLPWRIDLEPEPQPARFQRERLQEMPLQVRQFSTCRDAALLAYLAMRNISTGFLVEIDQFLRGHPEIATFPNGQDMLATINHLPPLDAYLYFLKGYTRPARYIDGIVLTDKFPLPLGFRPLPLRSKADQELDDFFEGFEFRWDILDRIDLEVAKACVQISNGYFVGSGLRRLVCYAVWGNAVDAYKWYEYNYQREYLAHTYLPEHVILCEVPRALDYTKPTPSGLGSSRRHMHVRSQMARANDEGVDVLDVLISEYRLTLVRNGFRRLEIDDMCLKAQRRLDDERAEPTGADIVDMLMDEIVTRGSARRQTHARRQYPPYRQRKARGSKAAKRKAPVVPAYLKAQAIARRAAKRNLKRLYGA
ncbi:hypothetical protein CC80DRAFT_531312 [Byssothecium circinans]|uniref:Uncharacterized protein n=1 Tax=Byssothecium circinans TaxID=147558 RepID=A0A6A5UFA9_9PLEO|nr:hypothetical protein CC80DRAFT_531312 [Byssothecium circinans]